MRVSNVIFFSKLAYLKNKLAQNTFIDIENLPYNEPFLSYLKNEKNNGLFDYAGNSKNDLIIFKHAQSSILVNFNKQLLSRSPSIHVAKSFAQENSILSTYMEAIRPHQWVKNLLIFVPLFVSNQWYSPLLIERASIGFMSFSLAASSVYVINDIFDMQNDRDHVKKKLAICCK